MPKAPENGSSPAGGDTPTGGIGVVDGKADATMKRVYKNAMGGKP